DFERLAPLDGADCPTLLIGAVDVLDGTFKTFSSRRRDVGIDALLASAAVPTLFPAAQVAGHAYWDGIFSSNPPVLAFLQRMYIGPGPLPEEIWIIQVNRTSREGVPQEPAEIFDRRNHLGGNLSLQHELQTI